MRGVVCLCVPSLTAKGTRCRYYISSQLLKQLLPLGDRISHLYLMLQASTRGSALGNSSVQCARLYPAARSRQTAASLQSM